MMLALTVLSTVLFLSTFDCSLSQTYYVQPTESDGAASSCEQRRDPCHTLSYYSQWNNYTSGSAFIFLPGNHILSGEVLKLSNVSNIMLTGQLSTITISTPSIAIKCFNITNLTVESVKFQFIVSTNSSHKTLQLHDSEVFALWLECSFNASIFNSKFEGPSSLMYVLESKTVNIMNCTFERSKGGALHIMYFSFVEICGCIFLENDSHDGGGAIRVVGNSEVHLNGRYQNYFGHNKATKNGGAIYIFDATLRMSLENVFFNNSALYDPASDIDYYRGGGAVSVSSGTFIIKGSAYFVNNFASDGGAIYIEGSRLILDTISLLFQGNKATAGGGIYVRQSSIELLASISRNITFAQNSASGLGGAIYIFNYNVVNRNVGLSGKFLNNHAQQQGGAIYAEFSKIHCENTIFIQNSFRALSLYESQIFFRTSTHFHQNPGGALKGGHSDIFFFNAVLFSQNIGSTNGGALNTLQGSLHLLGTVSEFIGNRANNNGGALYVAGTTVHISRLATFAQNRAGRNGGAVYLRSDAKLILGKSNTIARLNTAGNYANQSGGAIFHFDSPNTNQCFSRLSLSISAHCFWEAKLSFVIHSYNDTAGSGRGHFLYGGLLNRCNTERSRWGERGIFLERTICLPRDRAGKYITSDPYELSFCNGNARRHKETNVSVHRGQLFSVYVKAYAQRGTTSSDVVAVTSTTARIEAYQTTQTINDNCNSLQYTIYSTKSHEKIRMYADGPCRDSGDASVTINAVILPCPSGFALEKDTCSCDIRLYGYEVECTIPHLTKTSGSKLWIGVTYTNESYQGLVLASPCPFEYCKSGSVQLTLNDLDSQCDLNRAGLLCGACAANHSLMLGGSSCQICSNSYFALIIPFALMGVALVAFLTFLRLTVASGVFNSLILYCNILQTIRAFILPSNAQNVLTVFLAWMNLDFGIQVCFYDGLDAYVQTWLQFVFPLYVWLLIGSIILISRYSITMSKLIGHNPVAVLATLILMSYNKILKIVVEVFSFTKLEYPDSTTVKVWLKDANVPFLQSRRVVLTIATSLVLVFFFLPYTFLLLFGHKMYRFTGRRCFKWLNRMKPLLESYFAPYKVRTRYWTGLLLFIRCGLYIIFLRFSQNTNKVFITIILTFTILGFKLGILFSGRIYRKLVVNFVEAFIYLNLIALAAAAQAGLNSEPFVYTLIAMVFVIFVCTCGYQFHLVYINKTTTWQKLRQKISALRPKKQDAQDEPPPVNSSLDPHRIVTRTVIELREPLLETSN